MRRRFQTHLSYANVMATVAVFVALGGSSYAAVQLSRNSVRSEHIKSGEVRRGDLADDAVSSAKVKNGSLLSSDFKAGQLRGRPTYRAVVSANGTVYGGDAVVYKSSLTGSYSVRFGRNLDGCAATASLAHIATPPPGDTFQDAPPGRIVVHIPPGGRAASVSTYGQTGERQDIGFHIIVAC